MTQQPGDIDQRADRLGALAFSLRGHDFVVDQEVDLIRVSSPAHPGRELEVRCTPRASDDGRLWFESSGGPLAEAHDVTGALTAVKGLTAVRM
jgi:hypothetical protein